MIQVEMKLLSAIHPDRDRSLGLLSITNDGTGSKTRGNYDVTIYGRSGQVVKRGRVEHYPREAVGALNLLRRALEATGYTK